MDSLNSRSKSSVIRPSQFKPRTTSRFEDDGMHKTPVFEYDELSGDDRYVLMEATVHGDRGDIRVRLHDGIHYSYIDNILTIKADSKCFKDIFKGSLSHYDVAYVGENTYQKYKDAIQIYAKETK